MPPEHMGPSRLVSSMLREADRQGRAVAETTGELKKEEARITAGKMHFGSFVEAQHLGPLNPENERDRLIVKDTERTEQDLNIARSNREHARRRLTDAEAAVPANESPPVAPFLVIILAVLAMMMTFAMSLAQLPLFEEIDDPEMRLIASALMGFAVAGTCVASLYNLSTYQPDASVIKPKKTSGLGAFFGGLFMIFAFGLIRMATSDDNFMLTLGLMGLDSAILAYAKYSAMQHREKLSVHADRLDARLQKIKREADSRRDLQEMDKALSEAEATFNAAVALRDERIERDFDLPVVKLAVWSAWTEAYQQGIEENRRPHNPRRSAA